MSARRMAQIAVVGAVLSVVAVTVFVIVGLWEAAVIVVAGLLAATVVMLSILVVARVTPNHVRRAVDGAAAAQRTEIQRVASAVKAHRADTASAADAIATSARTVAAAQQSRLSTMEARMAELESRTTSIATTVASVENGTSAIQTAVTSGDRSRSTFERQLSWRLNRQVGHLEGLLQLYLHETTAGAMPLSGGWAVDPTSMSAALDAIARQRPQLVVELGGGTSTAWVARLLERQGSGRIVSFDHDGSYAEVTDAGIARMGLEHRVEVRVVDLVPTGLAEHDTPWYDSSAMTDLDGIDVLFVDGPPQGTGAMARYPALPVLFDRLADGALVLVDDATRDDESAMIDKWREAHPGLHEEIAIPRSGMRILRKH